MSCKVWSPAGAHHHHASVSRTFPCLLFYPIPVFLFLPLWQLEMSFKETSSCTLPWWPLFLCFFLFFLYLGLGIFPLSAKTARVPLAFVGLPTREAGQSVLHFLTVLSSFAYLTPMTTTQLVEEIVLGKWSFFLNLTLFPFAFQQSISSHFLVFSAQYQ